MGFGVPKRFVLNVNMDMEFRSHGLSTALWCPGCAGTLKVPVALKGSSGALCSLFPAGSLLPSHSNMVLCL